jgi:hypothetical protein
MEHANHPAGITSTPHSEAPVSATIESKKPALGPLLMSSQPCVGVMPPLLGEAKIREAWPSLASNAGLSSLAARLIKSIVLAPLGWMILAPLFGKKLFPFICRRYSLTNRRVMIQKGLKPVPVEEVALADIDEVRMVNLNEFFRCGDLELVSKGQVKLKLVAVPEPDSFRAAIINACVAWVPGKATTFNSFQSALAASKVVAS